MSCWVMSARTMTQLVEGQPAALDVGESLPCRIIGFSGPEVVLALEAQPEEEIEIGMEAYLLLESEGQLQAVRGRVTAPSAAEVVLRLTDDIRLGQRRVFSRAPIPLPVRVRSSDSGADWSSTTRDVSAGGVCVGREGPIPARDRSSSRSPWRATKWWPGRASCGSPRARSACSSRRSRRPTASCSRAWRSRSTARADRALGSVEVALSTEEETL